MRCFSQSSVIGTDLWTGGERFALHSDPNLEVIQTVYPLVLTYEMGVFIFEPEDPEIQDSALALSEELLIILFVTVGGNFSLTNMDLLDAHTYTIAIVYL